jgi:hypothetical protein
MPSSLMAVDRVAATIHRKFEEFLGSASAR